MAKVGVRNHALYFVGVLSYLVSLIPFYSINVVRSLILIPILAYTLPILEYLQPKVSILRLSYKDVLLVVLAGIPYLFIKPTPLLLVPLSLIFVTLWLFYTRNAMWGNVLGTTFLASLSMAWSVFVNNDFILPSVYWVLYIFTGALYVEYKIPYRKLDKKVVQASWLVSVVILAILSVGTPLMLVTLLEPSTRYLLPGAKLSSAKEIAKLGRSGIKKDILFIALLVLTGTISTLLQHPLYHF